MDREKNEERKSTSLRAATASPSCSKGTHCVESSDRDAIICAKWKDSPITITHSVTQEPNPIEGTNSSASSPHLRRKCPARKDPDFLWL